jgi:proline iminopeptidase
MTYLPIKGIPHYVEWISSKGSCRSSSRNPVMVFVHGWGGSGRYWRSTATALADQYDCLLYDLRGFGRSAGSANPCDPRDPAYRMEAYAEDLAELLQQLQLDRVILNAHSMGASIATLLAAAKPSCCRIERLILTSSGVFEYDPIAFKLFHTMSSWVVAFRPAWLPKIPGMDRLFMARFIHQPLPKSISQDFLMDYLQADQFPVWGTIYSAVSKQASQAMAAAFSALQIPTLLIAGEKDLIIPAALGRKAARLNPRVHYVEIPQTAHFPMLEDPEVYLQTIHGFLCQSLALG